jgi:pyridoxine 5-phosphate synthase
MKKQNSNNKIRLGVNIDHAATLRQVRGGTTDYPNLLDLCRSAKKGGAQQITIHLREDRRHIQDHDVQTLMKKRVLKMNLEMAVTSEMLKIALKYKPDWVCFVPEKREELTTEGGLDVVRMVQKLKPMIQKLQSKKIKVSLFIESSVDQVIASREVGADAVEFHTGSWVLKKNKLKSTEWGKLVTASIVANDLELGVHAGHGLDYQHTRWITKLPHLQEVNIGHSMICYSLMDGLTRVTQKMCQCLNG